MADFDTSKYIFKQFSDLDKSKSYDPNVFTYVKLARPGMLDFYTPYEGQVLTTFGDVINNRSALLMPITLSYRYEDEQNTKSQLDEAYNVNLQPLNKGNSTKVTTSIQSTTEGTIAQYTLPDYFRVDNQCINAYGLNGKSLGDNPFYISDPQINYGGSSGNNYHWNFIGKPTVIYNDFQSYSKYDIDIINYDETNKILTIEYSIEDTTWTQDYPFDKRVDKLIKYQQQSTANPTANVRYNHNFNYSNNTFDHQINFTQATVQSSINNILFKVYEWSFQQRQWVPTTAYPQYLSMGNHSANKNSLPAYITQSSDVADRGETSFTTTTSGSFGKTILKQSFKRNSFPFTVSQDYYAPLFNYLTPSLSVKASNNYSVEAIINSPSGYKVMDCLSMLDRSRFIVECTNGIVASPFTVDFNSPSYKILNYPIDRPDPPFGTWGVKIAGTGSGQTREVWRASRLDIKPTKTTITEPWPGITYSWPTSSDADNNWFLYSPNNSGYFYATNYYSWTQGTSVGVGVTVHTIFASKLTGYFTGNPYADGLVIFSPNENTYPNVEIPN